MGKITRAQSKAHDDALALLSLCRGLTADEKEFVFRNYNPMATNNVGKAAIFFTPFDLASELLPYLGGFSGRLLDAFAGIGVLAYHAWKKFHSNMNELVCVELNGDFVQAGKKLVPEATWIQGDMFDINLVAGLGIFNVAITNPPYGNVATGQEANKWLQYHGPMQLEAAEVILRITTKGGLMILQRVDQEHQLGPTPPSTHYKRWKKAFPGAMISEQSTDTSIYRDQWQGAKPDVVLADVSVDWCASDLRLPLGVPLKPEIWQVTVGAHRDANRRTLEASEQTIGPQPFDVVRLWENEDGNVTFIGEHEKAVRQALQDGQHVPSWVLDAYPYLQPGYVALAEAPTAKEPGTESVLVPPAPAPKPPAEIPAGWQQLAMF